MATKTKKTKKTKGTSKKKGTKAQAAKKAKPAAKAKPTANATKKKGAKPKRLSALDAAAAVLKKSGTPMRSRELITAMAERGLWTSPGGKTPHATLYAAITREIAAKGKDSRFEKTERGLFAIVG